MTIEDLDAYGIDSVRIDNLHAIDAGGKKCYAISFTASSYESDEEFATNGFLFDE